MKNFLILLLLLITLFITSAFLTSAQESPEFVVNSLLDEPRGCPDTCTLRHALALAQPGDKIGFAEGLSGTVLLQAPIVIDKSVSIIGPGANFIALDGGGTLQIITVQDDAAAEVSISGLTLQNGLGGPYTGGGIDVWNEGIESLTLESMIFQNNQSGRGGALLVNSIPHLVIQNSTFMNNAAADDEDPYGRTDGGALYIGITDYKSDYVISIIGSTFVSNTSAEYGGAVSIGVATNFYDTAAVTITNSTFAHNSAQTAGGAIWSGIETTLNYSTIADNEARSGAGLAGIFILNDNIISHNRSTLGSQGEDISGTIVASSGTNIIGTLADGIDESLLVFDQRVDPLLLEFGNYGGLTQTFA
ncbi:MAG: CSLREA domain-containing protein, partial [Anaerolineae bacterium]|nr:CSLREA domain-containing protein [Anaerolineae bacterium]